MPKARAQIIPLYLQHFFPQSPVLSLELEPVKRITVILSSKCWWKSKILLVNYITIINSFTCCLIKHASHWVLTWSLPCNLKRQHGYHGSKNCAGIISGNRWIFPSVAQDINQRGSYFFICMFILEKPRQLTIIDCTVGLLHKKQTHRSLPLKCWMCVSINTLF